MPVVKQPAEGQASGLDTFSYTDVEKQAEKLIELARAEASRILQKARDDAEVARSRAFEQGHVEGYQKGHEQGIIDGVLVGKDDALKEMTGQVEQFVETLDNSLRSFEANRAALEQRASTDITTLALAISEKVCKRAGLFKPEVCVANVESAVRLVLRARDVRICIHPEDFKHVEKMMPMFQRRWPAMKHTELVQDETITRGGCVITTAGGLVDADLQTQLDRLAEDLVPGSTVGPEAA